ncbi:uncharacterized protein V1516DRAFT_668460 [Lipomyces oligophaga]|uniref:uncharacterized protein n=1 Tax=Lipomyces oligophaga TaxID=45792 RepID=UPI0034CD6D18
MPLDSRTTSDLEHSSLLETNGKDTVAAPVMESETKEVLPPSADVEKPRYLGKPVTRSVDTESTFQSMIYDMVLWSFSVVFDLFFREIRPRGAYHIPHHGPIIFVGAPHANQFVDPIMLMRLIRNEAGRRLSFLTAAASMKRKFIGSVARAVSAIPVSRPQDLAKPGTGKIYIKDHAESQNVFGEGTLFTKECARGTLLILPKSTGTGVVERVISDTEIVMQKPFKDKAIKMLSHPTVYKKAPKIDQKQVYEKVFEYLNNGGCIGIFPEGGSHDRTSLLPLKAGVAIMALGAVDSNPQCNVKIVPCGMNYFHAHKFRSRAVIEFGAPMEVPSELVEKYGNGGEARREAISAMLELIQRSLMTVTVTSPDYDTLMVIQAARRLYKPAQKKLPLSLVIEMNRRLVIGYTHYKDDPRIMHLWQAVAAYNKSLRDLGIMDHQVEYAKLSTSTVLGKLIYRSLKLSVLVLGALPGAILFAPVFVATKKISKKKAAEALKASTVKIEAKDVVATWKILVAMGLAPALYWFYALLATYLTWRNNLFPSIRPVWWITVIAMIILPMISYAALRIGEIGMDIFKSLKPLFACLNPNTVTAVAKLRQTRVELSKEVTEMINSLGQDLFPDFDSKSTSALDSSYSQFVMSSDEETVRDIAY